MNAVYFEFGAPDGLRSRFLADAAEFGCWLRGLAEELSGEYPSAALDKVAEIAVRGAAALKTSDPGEARLIDRLMHDYWNFCTMTSRHGGEDITPAARLRFLPELSPSLPAASGELCSYYRRLFAGDSMAECSGHSYQSPDGIFRWSWLLPHEVVDFCDKLEIHASHFGHQDVLFELLTVLRLAKQEGSSLLVSVA